MQRLFVSAVAVLVLGTSAHAQSLPELQSRCANDAAAFFTKYKRDQADSTSPRYDYEKHYSESMKGCFMVMKEDAHWAQQPNGHNFSYRETTYRLFDVNAHRTLGYLSKISTNDPVFKPGGPIKAIDCDFDGVKCSGEAEWQAKVQPYVPSWRG